MQEIVQLSYSGLGRDRDREWNERFLDYIMPVQQCK